MQRRQLSFAGDVSLASFASAAVSDAPPTTPGALTSHLYAGFEREERQLLADASALLEDVFSADPPPADGYAQAIETCAQRLLRHSPCVADPGSLYIVLSALNACLFDPRGVAEQGARPGCELAALLLNVACRNRHGGRTALIDEAVASADRWSAVLHLHFTSIKQHATAAHRRDVVLQRRFFAAWADRLLRRRAAAERAAAHRLCRRHQEEQQQQQQQQQAAPATTPAAAVQRPDVLSLSPDTSVAASAASPSFLSRGGEGSSGSGNGALNRLFARTEPPHPGAYDTSRELSLGILQDLRSLLGVEAPAQQQQRPPPPPQQQSWISSPPPAMPPSGGSINVHTPPLESRPPDFSLLRSPLDDLDRSLRLQRAVAEGRAAAALRPPPAPQHQQQAPPPPPPQPPTRPSAADEAAAAADDARRVLRPALATWRQRFAARREAAAAAAAAAARVRKREEDEAEAEAEAAARLLRRSAAHRALLRWRLRLREAEACRALAARRTEAAAAAALAAWRRQLRGRILERAVARRAAAAALGLWRDRARCAAVQRRTLARCLRTWTLACAEREVGRRRTRTLLLEWRGCAALRVRRRRAAEDAFLTWRDAWRARAVLRDADCVARAGDRARRLRAALHAWAAAAAEAAEDREAEERVRAGCDGRLLRRGLAAWRDALWLREAGREADAAAAWACKRAAFARWRTVVTPAHLAEVYDACVEQRARRALAGWRRAAAAKRLRRRAVDGPLLRRAVAAWRSAGLERLAERVAEARRQRSCFGRWRARLARRQALEDGFADAAYEYAAQKRVFAAWRRARKAAEDKEVAGMVVADTHSLSLSLSLSLFVLQVDANPNPLDIFGASPPTDTSFLSRRRLQHAMCACDGVFDVGEKGRRSPEVACVAAKPREGQTGALLLGQSVKLQQHSTRRYHPPPTPSSIDVLISLLFWQTNRGIRTSTQQKRFIALTLFLFIAAAVVDLDSFLRELQLPATIENCPPPPFPVPSLSCCADDPPPTHRSL